MENVLHESNQWELTDYISALSCGTANLTLNNSKRTNSIKYTNVDSSPVYSKINYKFYNLKLINEICKKLKINPNNFQDYTFNIFKYFIFKNPIKKEYEKFIKYLKTCKLTFVDLDKSIKLSYLYIEYSKSYSSKKKREYNKGEKKTTNSGKKLNKKEGERKENINKNGGTCKAEN